MDQGASRSLEYVTSRQRSRTSGNAMERQRSESSASTALSMASSAAQRSSGGFGKARHSSDASASVIRSQRDQSFAESAVARKQPSRDPPAQFTAAVSAICSGSVSASWLAGVRTRKNKTDTTKRTNTSKAPEPRSE